MTTRTFAHGEQEVFGGKNNFWLYSKTHGYDLTHPRTPTSPLIFPRVPFETTKGPVAIDPAKTALVVIDLQNYFLSPHIGRPSDAVGLKVVDKLLQHAIPACRKAGIPIVWMNWGLTEQEIEEMPPTIVQGFATDHNFDGRRRIEGLGSDVGSVKLGDGTVIEGGGVLMPDQWNTALYTPLEEKRQPQDILIHKNRLSGFWGGTAKEEILESRGIRSLIFSGANVDQCVGGTLQDAVSRGWDCFLLSDGYATTSPAFAQQCIEYNAELGWGFLLSCEDLERSVENLQTRRRYQRQALIASDVHAALTPANSDNANYMKYTGVITRLIDALYGQQLHQLRRNYLPATVQIRRSEMKFQALRRLPLSRSEDLIQPSWHYAAPDGA